VSNYERAQQWVDECPVESPQTVAMLAVADSIAELTALLRPLVDAMTPPSRILDQTDEDWRKRAERAEAGLRWIADAGGPA
jgi:hypothetical protein